MADQKLSALTAGSAIVDADLFYSAPGAGGQVKQPASAFRIYMASSGIARTQASFTGTSITLVSQQILNCNCAVAPTIILPDAATRLGLPVTIIDIGGKALLQPITIQRAGTNTIQDTSTTSITLSNNYAVITLTPSNDGVTVGRWSIT